MVDKKEEKPVFGKKAVEKTAIDNKKAAGKTETNVETQVEEKTSQTGTKTSKKQIKPQKEFDPYNILKYPLSTEKSIRQIEFDNKIGFVVDKKATKPQIKRAVEEMFKVKVIKVNTQNSFRGDKRAYVKLSPEHLASDISGDLGLI